MEPTAQERASHVGTGANISAAIHFCPLPVLLIKRKIDRAVRDTAQSRPTHDLR